MKGWTALLGPKNKVPLNLKKSPMNMGNTPMNTNMRPMNMNKVFAGHASNRKV